MRARPPVTVIVPFAGTPAELSVTLARLAAIARRPGDEVIVADNRPGGTVAGETGEGIRVISATGIAAPGFARNRAVAGARGEWLVMIDADTEPIPGLLDAYFDPPPGPETAILAGGIVDRPGAAGGIAGRHSAGRAQMSHETTLRRGRWGYAQSANLAVRRDAFVSIGGFDEEARAGEDSDLCFRLAAAGLRLEERPAALVVHESRSTLPDLLRQLAVHGAGAAWVERRYPGAFPASTAPGLVRRLARHLTRALAAAARGHRAQALSELIGLLEAVAFEGGRHLSNRPRRALFTAREAR